MAAAVAREPRRLFALIGLLGVVCSAFVVLAPHVSAAGAPTFDGVGLNRDCTVQPNEFIPIGFVLYASGRTLNLDIEAPNGDHYQNQTPFTPDSDSWELSRFQTLKFSGNPNDAALLWKTGFWGRLYLLDASRDLDSPLATATVQLAACPGGSRTDFDGDGRDDNAVFRPSTGTWYVRALHPAPYDRSRHNVSVAWGKRGDIPVPADYNNDGRTDYAVFRPSNCTWYIHDGGPAVHWGKPGDVPVPANYWGFGPEVAVWRPSTGTWYVFDSHGFGQVHWGTAGDVPAPADYDGNRLTDFAVYRPSLSKFYIRGGLVNVVMGDRADTVPVPADYDGDGVEDVAVYLPSPHEWDVYPATSYTWGKDGDIAAPADFDGDGVTEAAVWRPSNGYWYIRTFEQVHWGMPGDIPIRPLA